MRTCLIAIDNATEAGARLR